MTIRPPPITSSDNDWMRYPRKNASKCGAGRTAVLREAGGDGPYADSITMVGQHPQAISTMPTEEGGATVLGDQYGRGQRGDGRQNDGPGDGVMKGKELLDVPAVSASSIEYDLTGIFRQLYPPHLNSGPGGQPLVLG